MLKYLFDGALGTYIFSKNAFYDFAELANISDEDTVIDIHREFINAGATAIRTNTFGANESKIPDAKLCENIIRAGFRLASEAAKFTDTQVFADIGPNTGANAEAETLRVTEVFLQEGAKNFIFETQNDSESLKPAITLIRSAAVDACVIVSFAVGQDGFNKNGVYCEQLFSCASAMGADYVGLNCICGPTHMLDLVKRLPRGKYKLAVMPNSGYSAEIDGRTAYTSDNPDYFATRLLEMHSLGAEIIGGCCGTTPEHIRRTVEALTQFEPEAHNLTAAQLVAPTRKQSQRKQDFMPRFIAVEIDPPQDADAHFIVRAAKEARAAGADYITVPDSPLGKTRANSLMIAAITQRHAQIPVIPHICCRDKNNIAIKGDLLAANIEGISRALVITGDAVRDNEKGESKNVFGFNSFRLISFIKSLNELAFSDNPYSICAALNINAERFDVELTRAEKKIDGGAECLFTQPIFSDIHLDNYFRARNRLNVKIAAGIMPLAGYKNALFLSNEVPGIDIPQSVIEMLKNANGDEVKEICLNYSKSIIDKIGGNYDGYYIMTPLKKIDFSAELVRYVRGKEGCYA